MGAGGDCRRTNAVVLASGALSPQFDLTSWHNISLISNGGSITAAIDNTTVFNTRSTSDHRHDVVYTSASPPTSSTSPTSPPSPPTSPTSPPTSPISPAGLASIVSGYHYSRFDDLSLFEVAPPSRWPHVLFDKHLLSPAAKYPGGSAYSPKLRNDLTGLVGCSFVAKTNVSVVALGRFVVAGSNSHKHTLRLVDVATNTTVAIGVIDLNVGGGGDDGDGGDSGDLNGYAWVTISAKILQTLPSATTPAPQPTTQPTATPQTTTTTTPPTPTVTEPDLLARRSLPSLISGRKYYLVSSEETGGDYFADSSTMVQSAPAATLGYASPVYTTNGTWVEQSVDHDTGLIGGFCYGPVNLETRPL